MAAFHFSAKILSRSAGRSSVRAAAYRAGEKLYDARTGESADYTRKQDVFRKEIIAPEGAPAWVCERAALWNRVEARERRKDAQLAQEFELNLPRELTADENWEIATDFVRRELVAKGRIADIAMHLAEASDGEAHPHVHILMPMRVLDGDGFGGKHPDVDRATFFQNRQRIEELRAAWCEFVRVEAAERGVDLGPDWDHRSLEARDLNIEPQPKVGATAARLLAQKGRAERAAEYRETLERNGERLLAEPGEALKALTTHASTFTERDLARWIHGHSTERQFAGILTKARAGAVAIGRDADGNVRLSTREMIALEARMMADAETMAARSGHGVDDRRSDRILAKSSLSDEQRAAAQHILQGGDLTALVGFAGAGKSTMLGQVREVLERSGYTVKGGALSGIAAENLQQGSDIEARTLASWAYAWAKGKDQLTAKDVLVIDEAGMIGSRQLAHVLHAARDAGAKVVLVGDAEQLQAIEAGAAFRAITERLGAAELTTIYRQREDWQRAATKELATGATAAALDRYQEAGAIRGTDTHEQARAAVVRAWLRDHHERPEASQLILANRNRDVRAINESVRDQRQAMGEIGPEIEIDTADGLRSFGAGDRLLFRRNDRGLGVKNGTLGWVEYAGIGEMVVRTDDGRRVAFNPELYQHLDHGYAVTVHKSQGVTVDKSYVLATDGFDRHLTYVAMSRHREEVAVVWSREDFADEAALKARLERQRTKDTTLDFAEQRREAREFDQRERARADERDESREERRRREAERMERELDAIRARNRERDRRRDGPER